MHFGGVQGGRLLRIGETHVFKEKEAPANRPERAEGGLAPSRHTLNGKATVRIPRPAEPQCFSVLRIEQSGHVAFGDPRGEPSASASVNVVFCQQPRLPGNAPRPSGHFYIPNS